MRSLSFFKQVSVSLSSMEEHEFPSPNGTFKVGSHASEQVHVESPWSAASIRYNSPEYKISVLLTAICPELGLEGLGARAKTSTTEPITIVYDNNSLRLSRRNEKRKEKREDMEIFNFKGNPDQLVKVLEAFTGKPLLLKELHTFMNKKLPGQVTWHEDFGF